MQLRQSLQLQVQPPIVNYDDYRNNYDCYYDAAQLQILHHPLQKHSHTAPASAVFVFVIAFLAWLPSGPQIVISVKAIAYVPSCVNLCYNIVLP
eukprot:6592118-Pyramimonas_sp.AAC.1